MKSRISTPHRSAIALAAALTLAAVGCGSDGSEGASPSTAEPTTTAAAALSLEDYTAGGNEVCDRIGADVQAAFPDLGETPTIDQIKKLGADLAPIFQDFRDSIAELDPPADLVAAHGALLAEVDDAVAGLEAMTTDQGAQAAIDAGGPPIDDATSAAAELFDHCPA